MQINFKTDPASLNKLSNVADNNVIKKAVYDKLIAKASIIDTKIPSTSRLVSKTKYDSNKESLQQRLKILLKRYLILVGQLQHKNYRNCKYKTRYQWFNQ